MAGYIKLYRKLIENPIMKKPGMLQLWIYCLLKANHKISRTHFGKDDIDVLPGQFITGRFELSADLGVKPSTIYKRLLMLSKTDFCNKNGNNKTLERIGFCNINSNNKNTLVTVINWHLYQAAEKESNINNNNKVTTKGKKVTQTRIEECKEEELKDTSSKEFDEKSIPFRLSKKLKEFILKNNPEAKEPNLQSWSLEFDRMIRIDKRDPKKIYEIMEFSQKDTFWKTNILSACALRKQYDKLKLKKETDNEKEIKVVVPREIIKAPEGWGK